jgi:hypothetical protein
VRAPPPRASARDRGPRPRPGAPARPPLGALVALGAASALGAFAAAAGCTSTLRAIECGPLPDRTACPTRGGGTCADRTCSALYECTSAGWQLVEGCPGNAPGAAGAGGAGGAAGAGGLGGAGGGCVAAPSAPPDGLPCSPLQAPECDESIALACPDRACLTECVVFLRCEAGEWREELAAYCEEETGELIVNPKR